MRRWREKTIPMMTRVATSATQINFWKVLLATAGQSPSAATLTGRRRCIKCTPPDGVVATRRVVDEVRDPVYFCIPGAGV